MEMDWKKKYDDVGSFQEGRVWVKLNGEHGFVDEEGNEVIPLKYDDVYSFFEGRARVKLNGKYGFVDLQGDVVIPLKYDWIGYFFKGKANMQIESFYGHVDLNGKDSFNPEVRAKLRQLKIERMLKYL